MQQTFNGRIHKYIYIYISLHLVRKRHKLQILIKFLVTLNGHILKIFELFFQFLDFLKFSLFFFYNYENEFGKTIRTRKFDGLAYSSRKKAVTTNATSPHRVWFILSKEISSILSEQKFLDTLQTELFNNDFQKYAKCKISAH